MKFIMALALAIPGLLLAAANKDIKVEFKNAEGKVIGTGTLSQLRKGLKINLDISGLTPGEHAIHFHENGKCEGAKFESAGGHLNPDGKEHGLDNPHGHHLGDMKNIVADKDGKIKTSVVNESATLASGPGSLKKEGGVAIVIHAHADDNKTNPSGASGDRVACAVLDVK
jgi:Cu-Zn family superoxide dismutase